MAVTVWAAGYGAFYVFGREFAAEADAAGDTDACNAIYELVARTDIAGVICLSGSFDGDVDQDRLSALLSSFKVLAASIGIEVEGTADINLTEESFGC